MIQVDRAITGKCCGIINREQHTSRQAGECSMIDKGSILHALADIR